MKKCLLFAFLSRVGFGSDWPAHLKVSKLGCELLGMGGGNLEKEVYSGEFKRNSFKFQPRRGPSL